MVQELPREGPADWSRRCRYGAESLVQVLTATPPPLFESLTAGREGSERVFTRRGAPWGKSEQQQRMRTACKSARIKPSLTFHGLRHSYASLYLMGGGGLPDLAKQLGHSTTRMVERHYGHLADAWRAERARDYAPSLGLGRGKVRRLSRTATTRR